METARKPSSDGICIVRTRVSTACALVFTGSEILSATNGATFMDLLIVGNRGGSNVGESFERAARNLQLSSIYLDASEAMAGPRLLRQASWHLRRRRPLSLGTFSRSVLEASRRVRPRILLTTGIAPVDAPALKSIGELGTVRCNFLTDDPWSVSHRNSWFLTALRHYDIVFTPRRSLRTDLSLQTGARVVDMLFGVDGELFHPVPLTAEEEQAYRSDVMFAGGADRDRIPYIDALHRAGLHTALYGGYWERYRETRAITRGPIPVSELPKAITASKVALCLVRRANRDQHCMRTFEVPAVGGCMLTEHTEDHRNLFGPEGSAVLYFNSIAEMLSKARWLVEHRTERNRLARAAHALVASGHTYQDRLQSILRESHAIDPGRPTDVGVEP